MVTAILSPFSYLHSLFLYNRKSTLYQLGINYQTCNLERLLNDTYDVVNRGIYITNIPTSFLPLLVSLKSEELPIKVGLKGSDEVMIKVAKKTETPSGQVNFIINIPEGVVFVESELRALVGAYALQTKTFSINIYI